MADGDPCRPGDPRDRGISGGPHLADPGDARASRGRGAALAQPAHGSSLDLGLVRRLGHLGSSRMDRRHHRDPTRHQHAPGRAPDGRPGVLAARDFRDGDHGALRCTKAAGNAGLIDHPHPGSFGWDHAPLLASVPRVNLLPLLPLLLVWLVVGAILTIVDLREHRLPNAITVPMLAVTPVGLVLADVIDGRVATTWTGWSGAALGALVWLIALGSIWFASRGAGMGLGDVKLSPSLGATLGWLSLETALLGLAMSFILGGVVSVVLLITKRVQRRTAIPFGPFLLLGSFAAVVTSL
jgi:Type II secretory pathway, prepilin signal peptidase PulO and related peptidases